MSWAKVFALWDELKNEGKNERIRGVFSENEERCGQQKRTKMQVK